MLTFGGCADKAAYTRAKNLNTTQAYQDFLNEYPNTEYSRQAKNNLIYLNYKKSKELNTIQSYKKFLKTYPNSKYSIQARENLIGLKYLEAKKQNTPQAYRKFIDEYPKTKYSSRVKEFLEKEDWNQAKKLDTEESYNQFLSDHKNSKYDKEANNRLLIKRYEKAEPLDKKEIVLLIDKVHYELSPFKIKELISGLPDEKYMSQSADLGGLEINNFSTTRFENTKEVTVSIVMAKMEKQVAQIKVAKKEGKISFSDFSKGNVGENTLFIFGPIHLSPKDLNSYGYIRLYREDNLKGVYLNDGTGKWRKMK